MRVRQDSRSIVALAVTLGLGLVVAACGDESDPSPSLPDAPVTTEGGRGGGSIGGGGGGAVDTGSTTEEDVDETVEVMNTGLIFPSGDIDDRPMLAITGCAPGNTCTAQVSFTNTGDQPINATLAFVDNNAYVVDATGGCNGTILEPGERCQLSVAILGMPADPEKICLGRLAIDPLINNYDTLYVCAEQQFNLCRMDPCP